LVFVNFHLKVSIVKSSKGKDQLLLDGYRYRRADKSESTWRCDKSKCAGRITSDGALYKKLTDHNHVPNPEEMIAAEFKSRIIERAMTSNDPPRRIINEAGVKAGTMPFKYCQFL
jgi:hypothetical protein